MRRYILRRLLLMPITLIGITFVVFFLTRMVPGGPVERILQEQAMGALMGEKSNSVPTLAMMAEDDIERLEEAFNLQEPVWLSYLQWVGIRRRQVENAKAEFNEEGLAYITLTSMSGHSAVIEVLRVGHTVSFHAEP